MGAAVAPASNAALLQMQRSCCALRPLCSQADIMLQAVGCVGAQDGSLRCAMQLCAFASHVDIAKVGSLVLLYAVPCALGFAMFLMCVCGCMCSGFGIAICCYMSRIIERRP